MWGTIWGFISKKFAGAKGGDVFIFILLIGMAIVMMGQVIAIESLREDLAIEQSERARAEDTLQRKDKQLNKYKAKQAEQDALLKEKEEQANADKKELSKVRRELNAAKKKNDALSDQLNQLLDDRVIGLLPESVRGE